MKFDPIKFEVVRNALVEVTEEMGIALRRSAYSTNIKTRADFSCAVFNQRLQFIASNFGQPTHLGSMVELVPKALKEYGVENLGPGDAILSNDPYLGGVHLNDIALIAPLYYRNELIGYLANIAHHVDVGGGAPASVGAFREVFQEGVIIPPVKLVAGGHVVRDIFRLVLSQIRSKHETAGDLRAQIAANSTGARRMTELIDGVGLDEFGTYSDELLAYSDRRTLADLKKLPQGEFRAEGQVDTDGFTDVPVVLKARVLIDDEGVFFDLTGCDPQRRAPVNSTYTQTLSACAYVLKCITDPDVPANDGFYRHVRLLAPLGTVVNCVTPAAVVGGFETHTRLVDTIFKALSQAMPDRIPAGTKAMMCHVGFGGIHPRTGDYYCFLETISGGYGGRAHSDGPDAVQAHGQNTQNAPIEETELNYPVRIVRYEIVDDSEGPGEHRGGLGVRRDYLFPDSAPTFTILADRDRQGPHGLFGGLPGRPAEYVLNPDGEAHVLSSKVTIDLRPGDVVSYRTCGGGGYGPPLKRDPQAVLRDVREAKITMERARDIYCVAIDPSTWSVDLEETERLHEAALGRVAQARR